MIRSEIFIMIKYIFIYLSQINLSHIKVFAKKRLHLLVVIALNCIDPLKTLEMEHKYTIAFKSKIREIIFELYSNYI